MSAADRNQLSSETPSSPVRGDEPPSSIGDHDSGDEGNFPDVAPSLSDEEPLGMEHIEERESDEGEDLFGDNMET